MERVEGKANTIVHATKPEPGHKVYPYLLRGIEIERPNQVWAMDITYIPMARGFLYDGGCLAGFRQRRGAAAAAVNRWSWDSRRDGDGDSTRGALTMLAAATVLLSSYCQRNARPSVRTTPAHDDGR